MAVCVLCLVLEGGIAITIGYGFVVLGRDTFLRWTSPANTCVLLQVLPAATTFGRKS